MAATLLAASLAACSSGCSGSNARQGDAGHGGQGLGGAAGGTGGRDAAADQIADADVDLGADVAMDAPAQEVELPPGTCTATQHCDPIVEVCLEDTGQPPPPGVDSCGTRWDCFTHLWDDDGTREHACPAETMDFCGCDGVTFTRPWFCPDRPYDHVGACDDGFSCDPERLKCADPEPSCPDGQVAAVVKGCWGACIPVSMCRCEFLWQCRQRDKYRCSAYPVFRCLAIPPGVDGGADASTD